MLLVVWSSEINNLQARLDPTEKNVEHFFQTTTCFCAVLSYSLFWSVLVGIMGCCYSENHFAELAT